MQKKYINDYSVFIARVEVLTRHSPSNLLDFYTEFIESISSGNHENYKQFDYEIDNDFHFRVQIQNVLDDSVLASNELKLEFQTKVLELDKKIKSYLIDDCANRTDWFKSIRFKPNI
jgi:hypothetical protein